MIQSTKESRTRITDPSEPLEFVFEVGSPANPVLLPMSKDEVFQLVNDQIDEHIPDLRKQVELGTSTGSFTICNNTITVKWTRATTIH
jgi:hypothetical protein